jgi:hypothetical protein
MPMFPFLPFVLLTQRNEGCHDICDSELNTPPDSKQENEEKNSIKCGNEDVGGQVEGRGAGRKRCCHGVDGWGQVLEEDVERDMARLSFNALLLYPFLTPSFDT